MNFTFENQGSNTFLVYAVGAQDSVDSMSLGMLTNNKIPGIAQAVYTQMDASKFIKYNVSAHVPVSQFFSGPVNQKRLIGVFKGIVDAMLSAEEYMIDSNSIIMDLDYIFADVSTCETVLICVPVVEIENKAVDLSAFFKNIMFSVQFDQTENCDYVAKIMTYLNSTPNFSLTEFKDVLFDIKKSGAAPVVEASQPIVEKPQPTPAPVAPATPTAAPTVPVAPVAPAPVVANNKATVAPIPQSQTSATPVAPPQVAPAPMPTPAPVENQKKISMFDLLMHYNKENAAAYKAQKAAEKNANHVPMPQKPAAPMQPKAAPGGFAVPGQAAPAPTPMPQKPAAPVQPKAAPGGFAVPGKAAPVPMPQKSAAPVQPKAAPGGFAIPGQPAPAPVPMPQKPVAPVQPKAAPGRFAIPGQAAPAPVAQPIPQPVAPMPVAPVAQPATPVAPPSKPMSFGDTTVLGGPTASGGETTVLGATVDPPPQLPYLTRVKTNERININVPFFKMGKERSYADYCISDNPAISRSHANIISRDGQYFVVDANSTNHTYVNGTMIQSGVETQINHGDKIRLGNEEFDFKLY